MKVVHGLDIFEQQRSRCQRRTRPHLRRRNEIAEQGEREEGPEPGG